MLEVDLQAAIIEADENEAHWLNSLDPVERALIIKYDVETASERGPLG